MKQRIVINALGIFFLAALCFLQTAAARAATTGEQLKQNGEHDSLMESFKQIRIAEKLTAEDAAESRFSQQAKLTASDGTFDDEFGVRVALSGDTAVIGAWKDDVGANANQGSAYVFVRSSSGAWTFQQKLTASDGAADDSFGYSVAIANAALPAQTVIMVGAFGDNIGANANQGSVYVFVRSSGGTTWNSGGKLTAADGAANDVFGNSVALTGSFAVIGANGDDVGNNVDTGSAYIFVRNGSVWEEQQKLASSFPLLNRNFGWSVDISGSLAVVGNNQTGTLAGAVEIFERVAGGNTWINLERLVGGGKFGSSVAISGEILVVGSPMLSALFTEDGAAGIYQRVNGNWQSRGAIYQADSAANDNFGRSVDISGDTIVVGASAADVEGVQDRGAAYIFARSGNVWTQQQKLTDSTGGVADFLGWSVAISGDTVIAGAYQDDVGASGQQGSASVFTLSGGTAFDFDGDGKSDVSVFRPSNGAWYLNQSQNGFAAVAFGQNGDKIVPADYDGDGRTDVAVYRAGTWYLQRSQLGFTGVGFGLATDIPVPADFDGDGKSEIAVFRPSNGGWYIYNLTTNQNSSFAFGTSGDVPVPSDYDGDGKSDIAVFRPSSGTWYLQRSALGFTGIGFGQSGDKPVPADYDGDGKTDVAVFRGGTWYLLRSQLGFTGVGFGLGTDVPTAADYDGDGKADVAVFRPSNGTWYLQRSTAGFTGLAFGTNGDVAVPSAYVP